MKNLFSRLALAVVALCVPNSIVSTAKAQGTTFTYQGQLQISGNPANGNYDFLFVLSNAPSGGSQVGSPITNLDLGVTNGLFTTTLNFGAVFTGNPAWLDISVRSNGVVNFTPLTSPQQLMPAPYAIFATTSSNLSGTVPATHLSGTLTNGQLANSSVTIGAGTGLSGGGAVALGGSTTLNNAGVLSLTGNSDITVNASTGAITLGDTATNVDTPGTIVKRDSSGNFAAGTVTANLAGSANLASNVVSGIHITNAVISGNGNGLTNLNATNLTGTIPNAALSTNVLVTTSAVNLQTNVYSSAGVYSLTIPSGVNQVTAKLWGAGGGGAESGPDPVGEGGTGGAGAFVQTTLSVIPGQNLTVVVGQHGDTSDNNAGGSSSGDAPGGNGNGQYGAQGGQASSLFYFNGSVNLMEAVAGGGGGASVIPGGVTGNANGGAGGNPGQAGLADYPIANGSANDTGGLNGTGGNGGIDNDQVDVGGDFTSGPGTNYAVNAAIFGIASPSAAGGGGGNGISGTGGGGGGGFGGGGAGAYLGGGAGGGSYGQTIIAGTNAQPGNSGDPNYVSPNGSGGSGFQVNGQDGMAVIIYNNAAGVTISGSISAASFSGNGSGLLNVNATSLLTDGITYITDGLTLSNGMKMGMPLNANEYPILLKAPGDVNHGLGYATSVTNFNGLGAPDGPMLWGYNGGALGAMNGGAKLDLVWTQSGNVGIGTTNPTAALQVANISGITIGANPGSGGYTALEMQLSSISGGYALLQAVQSAGTAYGNLILESFGGSVGIGTTNPLSALDVNGATGLTLESPGAPNNWNIYTFPSSGDLIFYPSSGGSGSHISQAGVYTQVSDVTLKKDIAPLENVLDRMLKLRPVSYRFKASPEDANTTLGFIAQEVEPLFPQIVGDMGQGLKGLSYAEFAPVTVKAIQELNQKIEAKDAEIQALKEKAARVDALERKLDELEATVKQLAPQK